MVAFLLALVSGILGSIIAHYICRAIDRNLGNNKR